MWTARVEPTSHIEGNSVWSLHSCAKTAACTVVSRRATSAVIAAAVAACGSCIHCTAATHLQVQSDHDTVQALIIGTIPPSPGAVSTVERAGFVYMFSVDEWPSATALATYQQAVGFEAGSLAQPRYHTNLIDHLPGELRCTSSVMPSLDTTAFPLLSVTLNLGLRCGLARISTAGELHCLHCIACEGVQLPSCHAGPACSGTLCVLHCSRQLFLCLHPQLLHLCAGVRHCCKRPILGCAFNRMPGCGAAVCNRSSWRWHQ